MCGLTPKNTRNENDALSQQTATMMSISRLSFYGIAITTLLCGFITSTVVAFVPSNNAAVANSRRSSSSLRMTLLTGNGKKVDVPAGSPLKNAVAKLGIKPKYSCKKWACWTLKLLFLSYVRLLNICIARYSCISQGRLWFMHHIPWGVTYQSMCW